MAHYLRSKALEYARNYWNLACHDHCIAISHDPQKRNFVTVPDGTEFVHVDDPSDKDYPEYAKPPTGQSIAYKQLDDCTHFISCCVGYAGGLFIPSDFKGMYGIVSAQRMVEHLTNRQYVTKLGDRLKKPTLPKTFDAGDIIAYYHHDTSRYGHLAVYLGSGKIACHTVCRSDDISCTWDNDWDLGAGDDNLLTTFLHISW